MAPDHHDLVLAITSHLPHLIAYTIVGTADELQTVTRSEVLKFSAGGFRDFTRIAASDPTMWRDVFLANKDAVLEMLGRFNEDIALLTKAIRSGDGEALFEHFTRTRAIRKGIVDIGQDSAAPDFGRPHPGLPHAPLPQALRGGAIDVKHAGVVPSGIGPRAKISPSSKRSGRVSARLPSSVAGRPIRLRPSVILAPACWRAASPRPGDRRSSMPASLSIGADFCTICRAPIAASNGSMPAMVMRSSPCKLAVGIERQRTAADRQRLALRQARLGDVDAAARRLNFAEARRPGLGREIVEAAQRQDDIGVERRQRHAVQRRQRALVERERQLDHRLGVDGAFDDAAVHLDMLGAQQSLPLAAGQPLDHRRRRAPAPRARAPPACRAGWTGQASS